MSTTERLGPITEDWFVKCVDKRGRDQYLSCKEQDEDGHRPKGPTMAVFDQAVASGKYQRVQEKCWKASRLLDSPCNSWLSQGVGEGRLHEAPEIADDMKTCSCGSGRLMQVSAHHRDSLCTTINGIFREGYNEGDLNMGTGPGGDDLDFDLCLDCGKVQGDWPLPKCRRELTEDEDDADYD